MAAWSAVGFINSVEVRNGDGDVLFSEASVDIPAIGHRTFVFDPPLAGQAIIISFDSSNLGSRSDDVCIDNIQFGQIQAPVPTESGTWGGVKNRYR